MEPSSAEKRRAYNSRKTREFNNRVTSKEKIIHQDYEKPKIFEAS